MEASLASLHDVSSMPGLDIGQVEDERKDMWRNLFKKYEDLEQHEDNIELSLDDLKHPEKFSQFFKDAKGTVLQPNSTLKRYMRDHADEMDEIATIAGPPMSDEEVLSDDSDEELLAEDDEGVDVTIDTEVEMPLTPASSTITDDNGEIEIKDIDVNCGDSDNDDKDTTLSEHGEETTLVDSDDEDCLLYTPNMLSQSINIFSNKRSPTQEPALKKPRLMSFPCNDRVSTDTLVNKEAGTSDEMKDAEKLGELQTKHISTINNNLVCCQCKTSSLYQALEVSEAQFVCDECMVGDHMECVVDDCEVCKDVGELIKFRRNAEVFARVQKQVKSINKEIV